MNLSILLPSQAFARVDDVVRLVAQTPQGSWGILPHRRNCVAVLVPGVLTFERQNQVTYVAVDAGVLIKVGPAVQISVRRALMGSDLGRLREAVEHGYAQLTRTQREVRNVGDRLESALLRGMQTFHHA